MIPVLDPFMAGVKPQGLQRGRGGFLRSADDSPYVSDPSGEVCKTGARKGEVKRLKYGSPSNRGREIENDAALVKYRQRLSFLGIGMDTALAEACRDLALMDADSDEFKHAADKIAVEADKLTRSWLAADRGTHGHLLCELFDREAQFSVAVLEAGNAVGLDQVTQIAVMNAWGAMVQLNRLEILAIEASCVDDKWRLAGTLDRIVRTTKPLTFAKSTGELVVIPDNTVIVGDLKFGKCRLAHPIQIASYAQSVPYDTETETRGEWGFDISQEHALIFHGSFDPPSIELVWVDLAAGREHGGETVVQAKAWAARDDIFSVAQIAAEHSPSPAAAGEVEAIAPAPSPAVLTLVDAKAALAKEPEQGADLSGDEYTEQWSTLQRHYGELDDAARAWLAELISAAMRHNLTFHARTLKTTRVYELYRALISLCASGGDSDELLRALMCLVVGDVALFPGIEPGHVVGSFNALEAATLAALVDRFHDGQMISVVDDDGTMRLIAA